MNTIGISKAAQALGLHVKTLQRLDREGKLVAGRTATGRRYYTQAQLLEFRGLRVPGGKKAVVVYCRVSSQAQRSDLANQRRVLEEFCAARGLSDVEFVQEVGGGLNFKRPGFLSIMDRLVGNEIATLVVAHRDRLVRFGFPFVQHLCEQHGCELLVLNNESLSPEQEMIQDMLAIVHCFSARLYGLRNYRKSLKAALEVQKP